MENVVFQHAVSKGSRFNQIYVPERHREDFEVGDVVEVRLLRKQNKIFYSENTKKLPDFKEKIVLDIFNILSKNKKIDQVLVFGSFLTKDVDYNDIDILLIGEEGIEGQAYRDLTSRLKLKFHIISANKENLLKTLEICPVTRGMLYYFVSNGEFKVSGETKLDIKHLRYLLMMPEDLLNVNLDSGRAYYDALRKLVTVEGFLQGKKIAPDEVDGELLEEISDKALQRIKENSIVNGHIIEGIQEIIDKKLKKIHELIKKWENKKK